MEKFDKEFNTKFLINCKLYSLRRNNLPSLTYQQVEKTLLKTKWTEGVPEHICEIAQDIENLTVEEVVDVLTKEAITTKYDLGNLEEDFKGENYEK